jgi:hypothetical protein
MTDKDVKTSADEAAEKYLRGLITEWELLRDLAGVLDSPKLYEVSMEAEGAWMASFPPQVAVELPLPPIGATQADIDEAIAKVNGYAETRYEKESTLHPYKQAEIDSAAAEISSIAVTETSTNMLKISERYPQGFIDDVEAIVWESVVDWLLSTIAVPGRVESLTKIRQESDDWCNELMMDLGRYIIHNNN